ncbi:DUF6287 domain-containing protein [Aerococcus sanguinicola]|uniref:DUF6287 domain-containing protein n=1 Tax=Aerococcus sanguinicola TaxID=119206 RepID=A0A0X8FAD9_9LACT|nr:MULTISPECIES: DUF6287 domain-containing protein [Aerococcus]AMB93704.1 hypothetical protein AWM72_02530 [Aerococcus sanguinicola]OFT94539.1 hypothetical protein HMPREF3090_05610 [Aerococcus sp. HMSC23C02]PKZ21566.1 hypothetical protein CYJ28_06565 [Aerococcus sanguinicola]
MKKFSQWALVLSTGLVLAACQNTTKQSTNNQSSSEPASEKVSSTASSSNSQEASTASSSQQTSSKSEAPAVKPEVDNMIAYGLTLQELAQAEENRPDYFVFYDIDGNGVDELLTATDYDGKLQYSDLYYLKGGQEPTLLARNYAASAGGLRQASDIFQDGTVLDSYHYSAHGEGEAQILRINPETLTEEVVEEGTYSVGDISTLDDFAGGRTPIDYDQLDWQRIDQVVLAESADQADAASSFDMSAILEGDYSSLVGTWQDGNGTTFEFTPEDIVYGDLTIYNSEAMSDGTVRLGIGPKSESIAAGALLIVIPAGHTPNGQSKIPDTYDGSDMSQDRLWAGQSLDFRDPNAFFYKVD